MKEILFEFPQDWEEWIVFIISWIVFLALAFILVIGIMYALNFWFTPDKEGQGYITSKRYYPAYTSYGIISTGKSTVIYPIYHHQQWTVRIDINSESDDVYVDEKFYQSAYNGQKIIAVYQQGRFWGGVNIKNFFEVK